MTRSFMVLRDTDTFNEGDIVYGSIVYENGVPIYYNISAEPEGNYYQRFPLSLLEETTGLE